MNPPASLQPRRRSLILTLLGGVLLLGVFCLACDTIWVVSSLRLSGDARALRDDLLARSPARWDKKIEVNAGWLTVSLAQAGLHFVRLDHRAQTACEALESGQAGIYETKHRVGGAESAALLGAADLMMAGRGWERLAGVLQPERMVAVYVQKKASSSRDLSLCFAVIEREHLVVGSIRGAAAPLMELAAREIDRRDRRPRSPALASSFPLRPAARPF